MVPTTLWPSWSMRLLANAASVKQKPDGFRAAFSALLLLPGGTTTYDRAVELLGSHDARATIISIRARFDDAHLTALLSCLAQLAAALDLRGSPIDYARRRSILTPAQTVVDRDAYDRLCARQGWPRATHDRLRLLDRYLLALLTGTHPLSNPDDPDMARQPGERAAFAWRWNLLRYRMPAELRGFLHAQALATLDAHGIDELAWWEPPARWVAGVAWPGVDPDLVDQRLVRRHAARGDRVTRMAKAVGMSVEHVRLYADITGITAPERRQRGRPLRTAHQGVLAPDRLRELYEQQGLSIDRIAKLARCGAPVVRDALQMGGIQIHAAHRPRSLPITREWLYDEYVNKGRVLRDIARDLGTSRPRVTSYAKEWGIPLRRGGHGPDPLAQLRRHVHVPPEIEAAFAGQGAVERIRRVVGLPGHRSVRAAAIALGAWQAPLSVQLRSLERAVGFTIIDRVSPLRPTTKGAAFIEQARRVLRLLSDNPDHP